MYYLKKKKVQALIILNDHKLFFYSDAKSEGYFSFVTIGRNILLSVMKIYTKKHDVCTYPQK
jgi:hypothetical protein